MADFKFFSQSFDGEPESAFEHFQMELIELHSNGFYNSKLGAIGTPWSNFTRNTIARAKVFQI